MGYFYSTPESVFGMVPARGESLRLDALIAQFEVLPESEVLRTPGGQKREHRAPERKTDDVFANCQPPMLYKDHHTPTHFRVSLSQFCSPPPDLSQICPKTPPKIRTPSSQIRFRASDRRSNAPGACHVSLAS